MLDSSRDLESANSLSEKSYNQGGSELISDASLLEAIKDERMKIDVLLVKTNSPSECSDQIEQVLKELKVPYDVSFGS